MAKTQASAKKSEKPQRSSKSRKPHRGSKVIVAIIVILVVLLGGLLTWFFAYYNHPDKVALDTINQFITADNIGLEGSFVFWTSDETKENNLVTQATITFDSSSNRLPVANTATLLLNLNPNKVQGEPKVAIKLQNIVMRNGALYFQVGGLMESLNTFSYSFEEWSRLEDFLPLIESIDNEWWQIDFNDILEALDLPGKQQNSLSELYSCVVEAINRDASPELARIYDRYRFIDVTPSKHLSPSEDAAKTKVASWHNAYEVTINREALANYINAIPESAAANEFYACFNAVEDKYADVPLSLGASDFDEISASDLKLLQDLQIFIETSTFGHKLRSVYAYYKDDNYQVNGSTLVKYQTVSVSAPDNYRPITDLMAEIIEFIDQNISTDEEK